MGQSPDLKIFTIFHFHQSRNHVKPITPLNPYPVCVSTSSAGTSRAQNFHLSPSAYLFKLHFGFMMPKCSMSMEAAFEFVRVSVDSVLLLRLLIGNGSLFWSLKLQTIPAPRCFFGRGVSCQFVLDGYRNGLGRIFLIRQKSLHFLTHGGQRVCHARARRLL